MREATCAKSIQALLVTSYLVASMSAAGGELRREGVTLSVKAHPRKEALSPRPEDWQEGVLSLRVVDPGRLVVKAGDDVIAAGALGWGEDRRLRVDPLEDYPSEALPRVVSREPGREEVEVAVPAGAGAGGLLTLTYEWDWEHKGKPALVRAWRLPPMEDNIPPEWLEDEPSEPEREGTPEDEEDSVLAFLAPQQAPLPVQVDPERPELLWVPGYASREELASRLFGDASAVGTFDFEPRPAPPNAEGEPHQCVRVRHPPALRPELLAQVRGALDERLKTDDTWSRAQLSAESLDRPGAEALVERGLRWSQRSEIPDGSGQSYFDSYLQTLAPWRDAKPHGSLGDTLAQDWHFLGEASEPLQKAIALRSRRWKTSYTVTDDSPILSPGDVVGRFYFPEGSSVQVQLQKLLLEERSLERAELRLRNLPRSGPRVIIPGEDGRWRGYSADFRLAAGAPEPLEHPEGDFYWYYPGTLFIRPDEWRLGMGSGTGELSALRRAILTTALATATPEAPEPLLGLDYDVLSLLTRDERLGVFDTVLESAALTSDGLEENAVQLLGRVVLSMPAEEFPTLERKLTSGGVLEKLLGSNASHKVLLGQAFTQKALASFPLVLRSLDDLPTFDLGREGETTYLLNVSSGLVPSKRVATEAWDVKKGVSLEAEPALPREAAGASQRMALYFEPVKHSFQARYLSSTEPDKRSRAFHPLEWVRVEVHGPQPSTQLMTAMELALHSSLPDEALVWAAMGRIGEMHMFYQAVSALTRAPLLTGVPATAAEGGTVAAAQRTAVRQFFGRMAWVTTLAVVDTYRDELSRTTEGRAFLAVHDLAMVALAGRDIYKLATSGIWRELALRGGLVLSQSGARASAGLRESVESIQALAKTLERMLAEGKAVATPDGLRFSLSGGAEAFKQAFFAIRGEMAAARALGGIRGAGLAAQEAEKTLEALKLLAAESQEMALAYNAVARRAAALPADRAHAYLAAVESLRTSARSAAKPTLPGLLHRSGAPSLTDPLAFLKEAEWLVSHPELEAEAVAELARKACRGRVDLGWLRSIGLTMDYLNFMARNEKTAWRLFRRAAAEPWNLKVQLQAREQLRGIAVEMLTERNAQKLFPGFRLTGRQVKMKAGHIIDNVLTAMTGSKLQHGVEVKGWNENRWRRALDSWLTQEAGIKLNEQQAALVKQLQHLLNQLADAAKAPHGQPFLVSTDNLSGPTRAKLLDFLFKHSPGTKLIQVEEAQILQQTKQLRAALKLPEDLSGGAP
ncbi:hypothetical protein [Vitiosangium sp. GDMCC 1.1324]|uniref:hypothetical protein n=1 Tax=Vitiosangium sp. (strain GDMCC 1.1324) TaxID=2138576 RepID=UPI000D332E89|nr:hypothetical protein [Vitiosangium sp. GDMCC 1.1324]PTL84589.1 hypothetical protein DAT35_05830 [Vitiosangium sp. GDMCC 1.1324]